MEKQQIDIIIKHTKGIDIDTKKNIGLLFFEAYQDSLEWANLLYKRGYAKELIEQTKHVDIYLNLQNKNISCIINNIKKEMIESTDKDNYFKELYNKDEHAIAIYEIAKSVRKAGR